MSINPAYPHDLALLPPKIDFNSKEIFDLLIKARSELAELKGISIGVPNPLLLLSPSILRESVASSEIENIVTTVVEALRNQLLPESERKEPDKEVLYYREAILWGFDQLKRVPISSRLILGIASRLIPRFKADYRLGQNALQNSATGKIVYMPPIAARIPGFISNWETFMNTSDDGLDPLIRNIIGHYQFESIHPFDDGNGRTGRILMVLFLVQSELLTYPILFISNYITKRKSEYYKYLRGVTQSDKWNDYVSYMLDGFYQQAKATKESLLAMIKLLENQKELVREKFRTIYSAEFLEVLYRFPVITPSKLSEEMKIHRETATRYLTELSTSKLGILQESKLGRYRIFSNIKLIQLLSK